jgi:serine/threonine protein kinase
MGEVRNLAKLRHKNIVDYKSTWIEFVKNIREADNNEIDICLDVNQNFHLIGPKNFRVNQYIQMELCQMTISDGIIKIREELSQSLNNSRLDYKNPALAHIATHLLLEIIKGLNYLHSQKPPLIHPDLHSGNVFLVDGMNGTFIRIGDLAPNESLQSTNDSAPNKKLNIQKAGILYANLLNFRANSDGSRSRSGGLAIDNELKAIKRSKLFMFFDCVIIITVFIQKSITRKEEQTLYQSFIRIIECKV